MQQVLQEVSMYTHIYSYNKKVTAKEKKTNIILTVVTMNYFNYDLELDEEG